MGPRVRLCGYSPVQCWHLLFQTVPVEEEDAAAPKARLGMFFNLYECALD